ncbi:MAG TPA: zinc ribbon domain-containing protein [Candidatus Limnocylindrales bacterium]|nr:zinc ribbon domain-containing protein [Candidatus Limnocylindrales bacterium]
MPKELQPVTDAIGSVFASPVVQLGLRAIALYVVVMWLACAYWAFRDLQSRTDNAIAPYAVAAFIIVFTPVFFIFAALLYRVVRPQERTGESYERNLAEEALMNEIDAVPHCPACSRRVKDDWIICPSCRTRLQRVCPNCSRLVGLDWSICAWCGRDFERPAAAAAAPFVEPAAEPGTTVRPSVRGGRIARGSPSLPAPVAPEPVPEG